MKLKKLEFKQILKLHLLKHKTYDQASLKNNNVNLTTNSTLNETIFNLKKTLQIIFQYHTQNKRILFVGVPSKLESKINKLTGHIAVPENTNIQGLISNRSDRTAINTKQLNKQKTIQFRSLFPKLFKKPDLVVVVGHEKVETIIKECAVARLSIISFQSKNNSRRIWPTCSYNLNLTNDKSLFSVGLNFLFKISNVQNKKSSDLKRMINRND